MSEETAKPNTISKEDRIAYAHQRLNRLRWQYAATILGQITAGLMMSLPVAALIGFFFFPPIIFLLIPGVVTLVFGGWIMDSVSSKQSIIKKELEEHKELYKEQLKEKPTKTLSKEGFEVMRVEELSQSLSAWVSNIKRDKKFFTITTEEEKRKISDFENIDGKCGKCSYECEKDNEGKIKSVKIIETRDRIKIRSLGGEPIGLLIAPFEYMIKLSTYPKIRNVFEFDIEGRLIDVQIDKNSARKSEDYQWKMAKNRGVSDPDKKLVKEYVKKALVDLKVPEESINKILGFSPCLLERLVDTVIRKKYVRDITISEDGNSVKFFGENSKNNQQFYVLERKISAEGKSEEKLEFVEKVELLVSNKAPQQDFAAKESDRRTASSDNKTNSRT